MDGPHHLHLRRRIHEKHEPYPHPEKLKRYLDRIMVFVAVLGPLATLPQVYQVYVSQDAKGLSLITWLVWMLLSGLWGLYGLLHREPPIVVSNALSVVLQGAVVIAIFVYS